MIRRFPQLRLCPAGMGQGDCAAQEDLCSKAFLCLARAFIMGLKGGPEPSAVNSLQFPLSFGRPLSALAFFRLVLAANGRRLACGTVGDTCPATCTCAGGPRSAVYDDSDAAVSGRRHLDAMVRQTAAGYRDAGTFAPGYGGGAAPGIDLTTTAWQLLFAHQIQQGIRSAGPLIMMPLPGV